MIYSVLYLTIYTKNHITLHGPRLRSDWIKLIINRSRRSSHRCHSPVQGPPASADIPNWRIEHEVSIPQTWLVIRQRDQPLHCTRIPSFFRKESVINPSCLKTKLSCKWVCRLQCLQTERRQGCAWAKFVFVKQLNNTVPWARISETDCIPGTR